MYRLYVLVSLLGAAKIYYFLWTLDAVRSKKRTGRLGKLAQPPGASFCIDLGISVVVLVWKSQAFSAVCPQLSVA